jgi:acetate kinase
MADAIAVLNAGSSSVKFSLFVARSGDLELHVRGQIEGIDAAPHFSAKRRDGAPPTEKFWPAGTQLGHDGALDHLIAFLHAELAGDHLVGVGHRVVHGGPDYSEPTLVSEAIIARLERFAPLAPLHQPNNLGPIRAIFERQPRLPQVACFDTAFHRGHPEVADRYAIPEALHAEGVRRYGFHGLSYEYIARRLGEVAPEIAKGRVVVAHLGSGASMCALVDGKSLECSMGFTALDGLPMGTRPGQLDAGVVLYLMSEKAMTAKAIERFLYNDCGLKGLSGISNDVRELLASSDPRAKLALDCFVYRIALFTGMLAAAMGGIDGFVFTAGIGENAPAIREAVAGRVAWLGLELDAAANAKGGPLISHKGSRIPCWVIGTDEELMIASHTLRVLRARASPRLEEKRA